MDKLDDDMLKLILQFVGDTKTFLSLEVMNKSFRRVLKEDTLWASTTRPRKPKRNQAHYDRIDSGEDDSDSESDDSSVEGTPMELRFTTYTNAEGPSCTRERVNLRRANRLDNDYSERTNAILRLVMPRVKAWRKGGKSFILKALGLRTWNRLVTTFLLPDIRWEDNTIKKYALRGDTSAVLMAYVEHWLVSQLEGALVVAIHRCRTKDPPAYPTVTCEDFRAYLESNGYSMADLFVGADYPTGTGGHICFNGCLDYYDEKQGELVERAVACMDRPGQFAGYVAGITRLDPGMHRAIFFNMLNVARLLLERPIHHIRLQGLPGRDSTEKQCIDLMHGESIQDYPPLPRYGERESSRYERSKQVVYLTIVPKMIRETAKQVGMTDPVYVPDTSWHVSLDSDEEDIFEEEQGSPFGYDSDDSEHRTFPLTDHEQRVEAEIAQAESEYLILGEDDSSLEDMDLSEDEYETDETDETEEL